MTFHFKNIFDGECLIVSIKQLNYSMKSLPKMTNVTSLNKYFYKQNMPNYKVNSAGVTVNFE